MINSKAPGPLEQLARIGRKVLLRFVGVALLGIPLVAMGAISDNLEPAGTIVMITGKGTVSDTSGTVRAIIKGGAVYNGEIVSSSAASYVNIRFSDGGMTLLRPHSRFRIEEYRNVPSAAGQSTNPRPADGSASTTSQPLQQISDVTPGPGSHAFFSLLKGGFRAISGLIGRVSHDDYAVTTPVATIGIRGTDYIAVICDKACANDPVILKALPRGLPPQGGLVTAVKHGRIVLGTKGQCPSDAAAAAGRTDCVEVSGGEYHFTSSDGQEYDLPAEPQFLKVDPIPDPLSCKG